MCYIERIKGEARKQVAGNGRPGTEDKNQVSDAAWVGKANEHRQKETGTEDVKSGFRK